MKRETFIFMLATQVLTSNLTQERADQFLKKFDEHLGYPLPKTVQEGVELLK